MSRRVIAALMLLSAPILGAIFHAMERNLFWAMGGCSALLMHYYAKEWKP